MDGEVILKTLKEFKTDWGRLDFLGREYPSLCAFIMKKRGMKEGLTRYMEDCKKLEYKFERYSFYVHGWLMPWF